MNERISKNENKGSNGNNSVVLSIWPICSRHRRGWDWLLVSDCGLESRRHHRRREERRRAVGGQPWVRSLERRRASARGVTRPYLAECGNTRASHGSCRERCIQKRKETTDVKNLDCVRSAVCRSFDFDLWFLCFA